MVFLKVEEIDSPPLNNNNNVHLRTLVWNDSKYRVCKYLLYVVSQFLM